MHIRAAKLEDIHKIVEIHLKAFEGFFLSLLGKKFLTLLYKSFLIENYGILRVAHSHNNEVVGFAAGTHAPKIFFSSLRKSKWFLFFIAALPSILKNPIRVVKKLFSAMFYKGDSPKELEYFALLSSIAVLPGLSGKSIGKRLLSDFEEQISLVNVSNIYLTTDKFDNENVIRFYIQSGYYIDSEFNQSDGRQMLRLIKSF